MNDLALQPLTIAISLGDPAGIGPEITLKAVADFLPTLPARNVRLRLVCSRTTLDRASAAGAFAAVISELNSGPDSLISAIDCGPEREPVAPGLVSAEGGRLAYAAVARAIDLCRDGVCDAMVTAPLNKEAMHLAGYPFAGHTEILAHLTGAKEAVMLLAHGNFRVSHVTTHCALADVPKRLTPQRLTRVIELTDQALRSLGVATPRIAVAALNPHAGEGGAFGKEDTVVTIPVIARCNSNGYHVEGPVPGDTVFVKLRAGRYDAVVAMYHDQGHIPVKLLGFDVDPVTGKWKSLSGVNITLGLTIIRTSVDHGTAFDIAGQGIANHDSMVEAIELAIRLAGSKAAWRAKHEVADVT